RFYINHAVDYIEFDLFKLAKEQFLVMWLCLAVDNLLNDIPLKIKESSISQEENITKKLYADYSKFREAIYQNLIKNNPDMDKLLLFKKTQKLLDRFLFIFFAEDRLLLPSNSIREILKEWNTLKDLDAYVPLYERFKKYFGYMHTGYKGNKYEIFAYNGGLFAPDEILDVITIDDMVLYDHTSRLSQYDFETDVDVNILGHIFENSLGDIENVQAEIKGENAESQKTKRKKDGIFYTPKYITKYIVENTIGKLCTDKRNELNIVDEEFASQTKKRNKNTLATLDNKLTEYRDWLINVTILDPACGSGAFLNQALDFLITEHGKIDDLRAQLWGDEIHFSDITTDILEKNLFGVDINEESVEIAKLSLWLKTAQKGRKLKTLSNNIKCGNSLIDDPEVAGEKAFNWYKEFPSVFEEKGKRAWHVTTATHNSRYSQRMFDNHVVVGEPEYFDIEDAIIISETVRDIVIADKLNVLEYNICADHMHILLVCEEEELSKIVGKIKSVSAKVRNRKRGYTASTVEDAEATVATAAPATRGHVAATVGTEAPATRGHVAATVGTEAPATRGHVATTVATVAPATRGHVAATVGTEAPATRGHAPLSDTSRNPSIRGNMQKQVWTQKFGKSEIKDEEYLANAIEYIRNNRKKHELPEIERIEELKKEFLCTIDQAFRTEYKGGFDVVIGNPPYVRAELLGFFRDYLVKNYSVFNPMGDLFSYFYEQSFNLLIPNGLFGFISNTFDKTTAGVSVREYLQNEVQFLKYVDFTEVQIFEGATTYPVIIIAKNKRINDQSFEYIKIPKSSQSPVIDIDFHEAVSVSQISLDKNNWSFKSNSSVKLIEKLKQNKTIKDVYGKSFRGLLTGLNEAFIIPKSYEISEHIKPIYEGKELEKWIFPESVQQLILFESKWTKKTYGDEISELEAIEKLKKEYPHLINQILPFEERAKNRYDKGDFYWELRNCAYYNMFEKPKIVFPNLQNSNKFAFDETGAYINAPAVILPTNDKFLIAILNSKLVWYFLTNICVVRNGGYIEVKPQYFEQIPIPIVSEEHKNQLTLLTTQIISKTVEKQKLQMKFSKLLFSNYSAIKQSKKLENWFELEFNEFKKELAKQKVTFTLSEESEWIEYFEEQSKNHKSVVTSISKIEKAIDQLVYALYGLNEDEIKIVEESI
ncbi:MAG: TaqI-like C-terminal specificity domain-containing protein, partial [Candidatus Cloacimonetes bacterium]|nr:TaqI-like C-terminal specificity domain-containing protein [Candidatus Cloacimonadota bacterium]